MQDTENFLGLHTEHTASQSSAQLSQFIIPQLRAADHIGDFSFRTKGQSHPVNVTSRGAVMGNHLIDTDSIHLSKYCLKPSPLARRYNSLIYG